MKTLLPCCAGLLLALVSGQAHASDPAPPIDTKAWYRLTTLFQGGCKSLDVVNDAKDETLRLAETADVSGQHWKFTPVSGGYYRLTTMFQGAGKSLDIVNDANDDTPILAPTGNFSGQHWKLSPLPNGGYRLTTEWKGKGKSLDIVNDANDDKPQLATTEDVDGQVWHLYKETTVGPVPAGLKADPFYKKYLDAEGIAVVSSAKVPDKALHAVRNMIREATSRMPAVKKALAVRKIKVAVMAISEVTSDLPEFKIFKGQKTTDGRPMDGVRGFGATATIPLQSCAEENVMCKSPDGHSTEDIFLHEFAHTLELGMQDVWGVQFTTELAALYASAKLKGLFANTYAQVDVHEYFAEGVQSWFGLNAESLPSDGIHNHVNTRKELRTYDPALHNFLRRYFPENDNNCSCHPKGKVQTVTSTSSSKKVHRVRPRPTTKATTSPRRIRLR